MTDPTADELIRVLQLEPHPEGGHYRQTWQAGSEAGSRPSGTCILFLLQENEVSHWHRVDAVEIWHFHAGAPLLLSQAACSSGPASRSILGPDPLSGQSPQLIVPEGHWQSARTTGAWTLAGCTVSPGFRFEGFELAPEEFDIPLG